MLPARREGGNCFGVTGAWTIALCALAGPLHSVRGRVFRPGPEKQAREQGYGGTGKSRAFWARWQRASQIAGESMLSQRHRQVREETYGGSHASDLIQEAVLATSFGSHAG